MASGLSLPLSTSSLGTLRTWAGISEQLRGPSPFFIPKKEQGTRDIQNGFKTADLKVSKEKRKPQFPEHLLCASQAQELTVDQTDVQSEKNTRKLSRETPKVCEGCGQGSL